MLFRLGYLLLCQGVTTLRATAVSPSTAAIFFAAPPPHSSPIAFRAWAPGRWDPRKPRLLSTSIGRCGRRRDLIGLEMFPLRKWGRTHKAQAERWLEEACRMKMDPACPAAGAERMGGVARVSTPVWPRDPARYCASALLASDQPPDWAPPQPGPSLKTFIL